jgi:cytosine/adenosine deaminase-related metal-dependent hydrolase
MKGVIPQHTGLTEFILQIVQYRQSAEEFILASMAAAETEMWENGIVAVGDICNNELSIQPKKKGRLRYHNFIEISGVPTFLAESRIKAGLALLNQFKESLAISGKHSIVPHAPYSVSAELFELLNQHTANQILSIHNQETKAENELFQKGTGAFMDMFQQMNIDASSFRPSGTSSLQKWVTYFTNKQQLFVGT